MEKHALIAAGGKGTRMDSYLPKQFAELAGKPVLMHSLEAFFRYDLNIHITVILAKTLHNQWEEMCIEYDCKIPHQLVDGGPTRFHSVKNGLKYIPDNSLVAVHDAARPLVSGKLIGQLYGFAKKSGNAIPVVDIQDSVRMVDHAMSKPLPRQKVRLVQTPQCFEASLLKKAYNSGYKETFTDDATVVEEMGERLYLVDGEKENLKITTMADFFAAEGILKAGKQQAGNL